MSQQDEKRQERGKVFFPTVGIFSLCCTKSYCVARGQDEKYMSGERIFPRQPAPLIVLSQLRFSYRQPCVLSYRDFCCHSVMKGLISRLTWYHADSPAFGQFSYWEERTHTRTNRLLRKQKLQLETDILFLQKNSRVKRHVLQSSCFIRPR